MQKLRDRLKEAREEKRLSQAALAKIVQCGQSTIASIENGRNQSSGIIVQLANALGVNASWLADGTPPKYPAAAGMAEEATVYNSGFTPLYKNTHIVTIPRYETGGSMGDGTVLRDQPGVIERLDVSREWLEKNVRGYTAAGNLCVVTGFGDSMRPMYNPGDPLIVDSGVKSVEFDAVYFFRVGEEGFIKRLQRVPGKGLLAISENQAYRDWVIEPDMDMEVFGRVLKVWCSEDF